MNTQRIGRLLSYPLLAAGAVLLLWGGRDAIEPLIGQRSTARAFRAVEARPAPVLRHGDPVAKLSIPRLDASLYVVQGDETSDLRIGPGHLEGSAMPGARGNCVIAGHRDTHFRVLKDIRKGDDVILETPSGQFLYRVASTHIVSPQDIAPLQPSTQAELHLITCYPFYYAGAAPKRFVVTAHLAGAVGSSAVVE